MTAQPSEPVTGAAAAVTHPVLIVGAGPIGLTAAAHAQARGLATVVLEAGSAAGAAVAEWSHVRLFSPWSELIDPVAEQLLASTGWKAPDSDAHPTGAQWLEHYLTPLAAALDATPEVQILPHHRVVGVARHGRDRLVAVDRESLPFVVHVETPGGRQRLTARAILDASGTWDGPNPLGADGYPAVGEREAADRITYGIPDLNDPATAARYAGKHVAVAGAGASAQNVLVGLDTLAATHPGTQVSWLVRRPAAVDAFGGGDNDQLAARGALGTAARNATSNPSFRTVTGFRAADVMPDATTGTLTLTSFDSLDGTPGPSLEGVDEVIVVTGFRPDHSWLSQVQLDLDPELDSPRLLAGEIHPAYHSCGSVSPHGAKVLAQPEQGLYLAGMKSYGRAPSFLAMTGFEQVRSIVAEIDGDHAAAERVELVLPETGVCGGSGVFDGASDGGGCCAPTPQLVTIGAPPSSAAAADESCCG